jgi:hypothetical protein
MRSLFGSESLKHRRPPIRHLSTSLRSTRGMSTTALLVDLPVALGDGSDTSAFGHGGTSLESCAGSAIQQPRNNSARRLLRFARIAHTESRRVRLVQWHEEWKTRPRTAQRPNAAGSSARSRGSRRRRGRVPPPPRAQKPSGACGRRWRPATRRRRAASRRAAAHGARRSARPGQRSE